MNPKWILFIACAAALSPNSLLAQWNTRQLAPVPPIASASATNASLTGTTGPVTTFQAGGQPTFVQPGASLPPTVVAPPVITSQPGIQPGMQPGLQPGTQFVQPGTQFVQPGAPVVSPPPVIPNMPAPPPGGLGGAGYDPYYQPLPGGLPPSASLGAPVLPGGMNWNTFGSTAGITPRAGGGTQIGDDVGLDSDLSWFHGFIPIFQTPGQSLWFIEGRAIKYHSSTGAFGYNFEGGYRWFSPTSNRVYGMYAGYDYRNTGQRGFDQIAFGAESLGPVWDFRANGYLLLSNETNFINFTDLAFQGNNLVGTANFIDAYNGFDAEVGYNLAAPGPNFDLRIFGGGYGFTSKNTKDAWGVRGRIEARWWNQVTAGASVQYDDVFDTTVFGYVSILFGGPNRGNPCGCPTVADRLGDPLHKNMHVVINRRSVADTVVLNPVDNQPLQFLHVDSNAPAAGANGTFENPYNNLTDVNANNNANVDVVLAHAGSQFTDETINLPFADQRLLGDSDVVTHTTASQFGTLTLPRANALAAKPILEGELVAATGPSVNVTASNVEVSGLRIQDPDGDGILVTGNGLTGFDINRNMISGADFNNGGVGEGIFLDGNATGSVTDNTIFGGNQDGLRVDGNFNGTIAGNMVNGNAGIGFNIEGEFQSGTMSGNSAIGNGGDGYFFNSIAGGLIDSNFAGNNGDDGFDLNNMFNGGVFSNNVSRRSRSSPHKNLTSLF